MLITSVPRTLIKSPRFGAPTVSFSGASVSSRSITGVPVLTGDVIALAFGKINLTANPPVNSKIWQGASSAGILGTFIMQNGPWGTTQRGATMAHYWRGLTPGSSLGFYYELYSSTTGTLASMYSDLTWVFLDVHDWGGGVGATASGQNAAAGTSVAATITPNKNNSILLGVAGYENNLAAPIGVNSGWDRIADATTGTGGDTVDAGVSFFSRQNSDTGNKTLTGSSAGAVSATGGAVGIVELY